MTYIQHSISCVSKLFNTPKSLNLDITRESESFQSFDNLYKTWDWLDIVSPYCGDSGRWSVSLATLGDRWCVLVPWLCDYQHQATQPPGTAIHIHVYTHHGSGLCWCSTHRRRSPWPPRTVWMWPKPMLILPRHLTTVTTWLLQAPGCRLCAGAK